MRAARYAASPLFAALLAACASGPAERGAPSSADNAAEVPATARATGEEESEDADDDDEPSGLPRSLDEAAARLEFVCPVPSHRYDAPARLEFGGEVVVIDGDVARWEGERATPGAVTIGVLGALKDASEQTRANVKHAAAAFKKRGVELVLAGGDLGEDTALEDVFRMLGESFDVPIVLHAGNMEWTSAFGKAWESARADHPQLINANWLSEIDLGGELHMLVLPGYHQLQFLRAGACRYTEPYLERLRHRAAELVAGGATVVLASHGPPHGEGSRALDVIYDDAENVGDPRTTALIKDAGVRFGLFNHILEAGGRACADPACKEPLRLPVRKPSASLFVNAGTASGLGWQMLSGEQSTGMAMVVTLSAAGGTAAVIQLPGK